MTTSKRPQNRTRFASWKLASYALAASAWIVPPTAIQAAAPLHPSGVVVPNGGHPTLPAPPMGGGPLPGGIGEPELVHGSYINFESAPVKPLALSQDGMRLYVVNTPNNSVTVLDASESALSVLRDIPVGLEPVTVAVRPQANGDELWIANLLSDNVSVVAAETGVLEAVVDVGDEPVNILFDESGATAFVVLQEGRLVAVDATTRGVLDSIELDGNTPRAAVYRDGQVIVAALHSGNNTSVVGNPVTFELAESNDVSLPLLWIGENFSVTAPIFADPLLSPWPDPPTMIQENSPLVLRIVPDAGIDEDNAWQQIVQAISDDNGEPDPVMVDLFVEEILEEFNVTVTNAEELFVHAINDVPDTADHDLIVVNVTDPAAMFVERIVGNVGTTLTGMGLNPVTGALFVSNLEPRNLVRHEPNLTGHIVDHEIVIVRGPNQSLITHRNLHAGVAGFNNVNGPNVPAQQASLANPVDIVFSADGTRAYVAALGPGRVGVLASQNAAVLGRVDVGRGPRGLALDADREFLYVLNRTDHTISVVDVSSDAPQVLNNFALFNPEPAHIREGRDFLYSTRFSFNFASACAMCHIDGSLDHLAWDLGDPDGELQIPPPNLPQEANHPVKGPMVTQSLRGLDRRAPFHWRGDKEVFQDFNGAFASLLGGEELSDEEMDAYAAFIDSVVYPPNPFRHRDNSFTNADAINGTALYNQTCQNCHQVQNDGAMKVEDVEADAGLDLAGLFMQLQITTQLRGIHKKFNSDRYNGFGLVHDGREKREDNDHPLRTFLLNFFPAIGNDDQLSAELIAFVEAFPTNVAPVVGWQVHAVAPFGDQVLADINLMIAQHALTPSPCDVVAKGTIDGVPRGFVLTDAGPTIRFQSDTDEELSLAELLALAASNDGVVLTAVPPGSGPRIGINQDLDCLSDGLDAEPQLKNIGDFDRDADVDFADFAALQRCFGATGDGLEEACRCAFDVDDDRDVDAIDFSAYLSGVTGP